MKSVQYCLTEQNKTELVKRTTDLLNDNWMRHFDDEVRILCRAIGQVVKNDIWIESSQDILAPVPDEGQLKGLVLLDRLGQELTWNGG